MESSTMRSDVVRRRPMSAGVARPGSDESTPPRTRRPQSAGSTSRLLSPNSTLSAGHGKSTLRSFLNTTAPLRPVGPIQVSGREPKAKRYSRHPPMHVWERLSDTTSVPWEQKWATMINDKDRSCSIPSSISSILSAMWRDSMRAGQRFLTVLESCYNCEDHCGTTKHKSETYRSYADLVANAVTSSFPFMCFTQLHQSRHFQALFPQPRRVGACEVYVLLPEGPNSLHCKIYLLHSKLTSLTWPCAQNLRWRARTVLPAVLTRLNEALLANIDFAEGQSLLDESDAWGFTEDAFEPLGELRARLAAARGCLSKGEQALASNDPAMLRTALQEGLDLQIPAEQTTAWRDELKHKNMFVLSFAVKARRFQRNASFAAAVRFLQAAALKPMKLSILQAAIDKARDADIPEEEYAILEDILKQAHQVCGSLNLSLKTNDAGQLIDALARLEESGVTDKLAEDAHCALGNLAASVSRAASQRDLVELNVLLSSWKLELPDSSIYISPSLKQDFNKILEAEAVRIRLQELVNEAERRFIAKRWQALQSALDRLKNVHVEDQIWERWMSAMKREKNFKTISAVSGVGWELKKQLYTARLETALKARSIPLHQFVEAVNAAEVHKVDASLISRARGEVMTIQQRWKTAQEAVNRKSVDTAEVMMWKLKSSRVVMEEWSCRTGPLWELVDTIRAAEATKDQQLMQQAIEGWSEDKPGVRHEAFDAADSATRLFRFAQSRIDELKLLELRQEINQSLTLLNSGDRSMDLKSEMKRTGEILRQMVQLGYEMTPAKSARLLSLLGKVTAESGREVSLSRLSSAILQMCEGPAQFLFLLDFCSQSSSENEEHVAVIVECAKHLRECNKDAAFTVSDEAPAEFTSNIEDLEKQLSQIGGIPRAKPTRKTPSAFRKASELFKQSKGCEESSSRDPSRVVFNFMSSEPVNVKESHKALRVLQALDVTVVSFGISQEVSITSLEKLSSPGLMFKLDALSALRTFLMDSFKETLKILQTSQTSDQDVIIRMLEETSCE